MVWRVPAVLGLLASLVAYTVFRAAVDTPRLISPQGCRMSWMSPSYLVQSEFNASWTPLAHRYSLLLYREVAWEPNQPVGLPVLFIPGNAGTSHQVRSIASSAARQYFSSPFVVSEEFTGRGAKPVDIYAAEFNEDLSAFHGPTLDAQIAYASAAIDYILSRYPPGTQITVMGHSMGGVAGTALLPSKHIKALITMSTPHTLPPARFDARIQAIYDQNQILLREVATPILSICGGATDTMIPSESCILPEASVPVYRRTVFTSALDGVWTGVGHREMVWCHQVRWRVARAVLELGVTRPVEAPVRVLDRWLNDGRVSQRGSGAMQEWRLAKGEYEVLSREGPLILKGPLGMRTYLLPIPMSRAEDEGERDGWTFVAYVSQGTMAGVSPYRALDLRVSVDACADAANGSVVCDALVPGSVGLLPAPIPGKSFPVPDDGADESEGVVFFEAEVPRAVKGWVGVTVDADDDGRGWVAAGFSPARHVESALRFWDLIWGGVDISLPQSDDVASKVHIRLPRLPASALLVYRLVPKSVEYSLCTAPLFSALLVHTSQPSETHYYRLVPGQPVFVHTHSSGPYTPTRFHGLNFTIHSSIPGCQHITEMHLSVDWWALVGRIGLRFPTTLLSWGVGIVSLLLFHSWGLDGERLSVPESLGMFVKHQMPVLMIVAGVTGLLPLGSDYYLGIGSELSLLRMALAVLLVGVATGMVCVSWWLLIGLMWPLRLLRRAFISSKSHDVGVRRATIISMVLVLVLIFLFVPWQVAFLGCWITQLSNCITTFPCKPYQGSVSTLASTPTSDKATEEDDSLVRPNHTLQPMFANAYHQNASLLLLMTWLLPLAAPVLVVWVRTIQTAGYTTPFNGDHNVFKVVPVLILVDILGRRRSLDTMTGQFPLRWGWVVVAVIGFTVGGRRAYVVYDAANVQLGVVLVLQMKVWFYE